MWQKLWSRSGKSGCEKLETTDKAPRWDGLRNGSGLPRCMNPMMLVELPAHTRPLTSIKEPSMLESDAGSCRPTADTPKTINATPG